MSTHTEEARAPSSAVMAKVSLSVHRDVHRKIKAVTDFHGLSFQEWAYPILVEAMLRDLDSALASLRD